MNLREAAQQALEAFEWNYATDLDNIPACEQWAKMLKENITALRAALAEPQTTHWEGCEEVHPECRTAPAPRKPLTYDELEPLCEAFDSYDTTQNELVEFARAIERAHGITGETK